MDKKQVFLLRYVALAFAVLAPLRRFIGASHTPNLSCSEFRPRLAAGQVGDVVAKEGVAVGRLKADGLEAILPAAVVQSLNKQDGEPRYGQDAFDRIITGPEKKNRVMIPMERRFVVFHEAGHALVAELQEAAA